MKYKEEATIDAAEEATGWISPPDGIGQIYVESSSFAGTFQLMVRPNESAITFELDYDGEGVADTNHTFTLDGSESGFTKVFETKYGFEYQVYCAARSAGSALVMIMA